MRRHGPWTIVTSRQVYQDPWLQLTVDDVVRPDGLPGTYSTLHLKPGVCVIAVGDSDDVYLTREFHYAVGRVTIEGVSGGIEETEDPLEAARRELREELGIIAREWRSLGFVDPFTAAVLSPTKLYMASQLSFVPPENEGTERIECVQMSIDQALAMVDQSEITHAPTCVALLKVALLRGR